MEFVKNVENFQFLIDEINGEFDNFFEVIISG